MSSVWERVEAEKSEETSAFRHIEAPRQSAGNLLGVFRSKTLEHARQPQLCKQRSAEREADPESLLGQTLRAINAHADEQAKCAHA